jgi:hypothetical protein
MDDDYDLIEKMKKDADRSMTGMTDVTIYNPQGKADHIKVVSNGNGFYSVFHDRY